jgi:hypothetical protein
VDVKILQVIKIVIDFFYILFQDLNNFFVNIPRFVKERNRFLKQGGKIDRIVSVLSDYNANSGDAKGDYFHQDLLVAQFIYKNNPIKHVDIGSRIDGFVAHVASFREIEVFDLRKLPNSNHSNIKFKQADLLLMEAREISDSISCLHSIEHIGLGRYSDDIDPFGHLKGFEVLVQLLKDCGILYISVPIGEVNEVHFNSQRIFHPKEILRWAEVNLNC